MLSSTKGFCNELEKFKFKKEYSEHGKAFLTQTMNRIEKYSVQTGFTIRLFGRHFHYSFGNSGVIKIDGREKRVPANIKTLYDECASLMRMVNALPLDQVRIDQHQDVLVDRAKEQFAALLERCASAANTWPFFKNQEARAWLAAKTELERIHFDFKPFTPKRRF